MEQMLIVVGLAFFAAFGACVRWLNSTDKKKRKIRVLLIEVSTASFLGIIVFLLYMMNEWNVYMTFALSGVVGLAGDRAAQVLVKTVFARAGMKYDDDGTAGMIKKEVAG